MATTRDTFIKDGSQGVTIERAWPVNNDASGEKVGEVIARLRYDFAERASHVAFYVPDMPGVACAEAKLLKEVPTVLKWSSEVPLSRGTGTDKVDGQDLPFSGQIHFYSERPVRGAYKAQMISEARRAGHTVTFVSEAQPSEPQAPNADHAATSKPEAEQSDPPARSASDKGEEVTFKPKAEQDDSSSARSRPASAGRRRSWFPLKGAGADKK